MSTPPDDSDLLSIDRDLTPQERDKLEALSRRGWLQVMELLALRSKAAYGVTHSKTFTRCVQQHMDDADRDEMMGADLYRCPQCSTLLKDRHSPTASAILLERNRLAALWLNVETAKFEEFDAALARFRRALGLEE